MRIELQSSREDDFEAMARRMRRWVGEVVTGGFQEHPLGECWSPAVNLYEDRSCYCVVAELAGVDTERVDLHTEGRRLVLKGVRQPPRMRECREPVRLHHMEIDHGRFRRVIDLPSDVDRDAIEAKYCRGLLWIHLPKKKSS